MRIVQYGGGGGRGACENKEEVMLREGTCGCDRLRLNI